MGVNSVTDPYSDANFYTYYFDAAQGASIFTVKASAILPTTFMRIAGYNQMNVASTGQATRKLVDLSLALDISGSISSAWTEVSKAASDFVDSFDEYNDRIALTVYSDGGKVLDAMQTTNRGYNKSKIDTDIANHGSMLMNYTAMAEGVIPGLR